jgi:predicted metal-dependent HD superfamily phosphohydrolase
VLARYAEPHRHYHTVAHVAAVVEALFLDLAADPASVELAAFFHDAVYDPEAPPGANERASAALAASSLPGVGVPAPAVGEVVRLVLTTIDHRSWPGDANAAVLNDADLSTLGAAPGVYGAYVAGVRAEYAWLGEREWRAGRGRVVLGLLARPRLYATERGVARWEAAARANLRAELEELEATN